MSSIDNNKDIARQFMNLLGTTNVTGLQNLMAEEIKWIIPQDPEYSPLGGVHNKTEWADLYRGFLFMAPQGVKYTIIGITAEGDRVALEAEANADTLAGRFNNRYHFLFQLHDGLIVLAKEYADSLYMHMFAKKAAH